MAETCDEACLEITEVRSPLSPTFSSFRDQGNPPKLKAFIMSRVNKEEPPPAASKPMPPLEPLDYSSKATPVQDCPSPLARLHPKKQRIDAGGEPQQEAWDASRAIPAALLPPSPLSPGSYEGRDDLRRRRLASAFRPEKNCGRPTGDFLPAHLLSPSLAPSDLNAVASRSSSAFGAASPRTLSAFREVSPSCGSVDDVTLPEGVALIGRKRRRSPDGDASESEGGDGARASARAHCDGAALDLSSSSAPTHPAPDPPPPPPPSCLATHVRRRPPDLYGRSPGLPRATGEPEDEGHAQYLPRVLVGPPEGRGGLPRPGWAAAGAAHPASRPGGVVQLTGFRGLALAPCQRPPGVAAVPPRTHLRGAAHPSSGQCGNGLPRPDPGFGAPRLGPAWNGGTRSLEHAEAGPGSRLGSLMGRQVRPYAVGYGCDLTLEGGRHRTAGDDSPRHLRTLLQPQKTFPSPLFHSSGNQSRRMPSEISYRYPSTHDVPKSSLRMPSASSKKYEWSCSKREVEYMNKPIVKWTNEDVVEFIYTASSKLNCEDDQINCALLSGMKGSYLLQLDEHGFKQLCTKDGDKIYRYFQEYKANEDRRHLHAAESHLHYFSNSHLYSSALDLNSDKCTHQPPLDPRETAAPYEVRYENIDYRGLCFDDKSKNLLSSDKLPSAAMKSFAPLTTKTPPGLSNGTTENISDPEQSTSEEEPRPEPPKKRGPGRPRKPENELKKKKKKTGRLWEFIRNLLLDPATCPSLVRWENAEEGMFRFVQAEKVAQKWGDRKQNTEMNYEKLSRAMRYYYKTNIFEAVLGRRLVYKFE